MKKYIFNDNTKVIFLKDGKILFQHRNKRRKEIIDKEFYVKIVNAYKDNIIISEDTTEFTKKEIQFLYKNNIIKDLNPISEKYINTKYEKFQIYLDNVLKGAATKDYIEINKTKKVMFVGAGGICTSVIDYLISVGINKYCIIDFDFVERNNFNRQFKYKESDIGELKINSLKKNLEEQYNGLDIIIKDKKICSSENLNDIIIEYNPDFVICAADNPILLIHKYVAESCEKNSIPCIFGGVGQETGIVGPLLYTNRGYKNYLKEIDNVLLSVDTMFPCKGSFSITNSLISNYMARDVIFYLMGEKSKIFSLNKKVEIKFDRNEIYERKEY